MRRLDIIVVTPAAMLSEAGLADGRNIAIEFDSEARNYPWFCNVRLEGTVDVWA